MTPEQLAQVTARNGNALSAMLMQLAPTIAKAVGQIKPLMDQPLVRLPYNFPLAQSTIVPAGQSLPLQSTDFLNALEWPFEIHAIKFAQDPSHTYQDWQVAIQDQTFNQPFQKSAINVIDLVDNNTGVWALGMPWISRPKGGGMQVTATNLDTVNPIVVNLSFRGYLLIPR